MFIFFMKWEELCSPAKKNSAALPGRIVKSCQEELYSPATATFETRATFKNPNFQSLSVLGKTWKYWCLRSMLNETFYFHKF